MNKELVEKSIRKIQQKENEFKMTVIVNAMMETYGELRDLSSDSAYQLHIDSDTATHNYIMTSETIFSNPEKLEFHEKKQFLEYHTMLVERTSEKLRNDQKRTH